MRLRSITLLALLIAVALSSGCATSPTGRSQLMLVSETQAIASSRQAYSNTLSSYSKEGKIISDPKVVTRVQGITDRLIKQALKMRPDTKEWAWEIKVIDKPKEVNAWCMAGGKMAIYTGLLRKIKPTDDELAQVLGHEISHALANHTAERMSVAMASSLGVSLLGILTDSDALARGAGVVAAKLAIELPNSREGETEADHIGMELAAKAGYDPLAAVTLWEKMAKQGGRLPEFLSTHPDPGNRQTRLKQLAQEMMPHYERSKAQVKR